MATTDIYAQAYDLFKVWVKKYETFFFPLQDSLRRAHIQVPAEHWAAFTILVGALAALPALILSIMFSVLFAGVKVQSIIFGFFIGCAIIAIAFLTAYYYPSIVAGERKKKIENALSFATIYMSTIARSGFPPQEIFRLLGSFKEYGEISQESTKIANDVSALGLDMPAALNRAVARSP